MYYIRVANLLSVSSIYSKEATILTYNLTFYLQFNGLEFLNIWRIRLLRHKYMVWDLIILWNYAEFAMNYIVIKWCTTHRTLDAFKA